MRARRRRVRAGEPRAQAPARQGDPGERPDRRDDRRRRQRRPGAEKGRHRRRHGDQGHRGDQRGGRHDPRRRQFRLDLGRREGRPHRLQQHREGDAFPVADQCGPGRRHRGRDPVLLHAADHRAAGPLGQHGDLGRARPCHRVRAARGRRDAKIAARGRPADRDGVRNSGASFSSARRLSSTRLWPSSG